MKKFIFVIFIIIFLIPKVSGWNFETHKAIVDEVYFSMPADLQENLDLDLIRKGSITPDKYFKDHKMHSYPNSYDKALYWLNITKNSLKNKDYENASYAFGIATHYISDSFSAPHNIKGEEYYLHSRFEDQVKNIDIECRKFDYDLNLSLFKATKNNEDWEEWLKGYNKEIPEKEVGEAMGLIYTVALDIFNTTCTPRNTEVINEKFKIGNKAKIFGIFLILFLFIIIFDVVKKKSLDRKNICL